MILRFIIGLLIFLFAHGEAYSGIIIPTRPPIVRPTAPSTSPHRPHHSRKDTSSEQMHSETCKISKKRKDHARGKCENRGGKGNEKK